MSGAGATPLSSSVDCQQAPSPSFPSYSGRGRPSTATPLLTRRISTTGASRSSFVSSRRAPRGPWWGDNFARSTSPPVGNWSLPRSWPSAREAAGAVRYRRINSPPGDWQLSSSSLPASASSTPPFWAPFLVAASLGWGLWYAVSAGAFIASVYYLFWTREALLASRFTTPFPGPSPFIGLVAWWGLGEFVRSVIARPASASCTNRRRG